MRHVTCLRDIPWRAQVLVVECKSAAKLRLARPQAKVWLWMQGIFPEEALMHFDSRARERLQNMFERFSLPYVRGVFMVSTAMQLHFRRKYPWLDVPSFVMPCANASLQAAAFRHPGKYEAPSFVYAGSLHKWQCFELTLEVYRRFKAKHPQARLSVFTADAEMARRRVESAGLSDVEIGSLSLNELSARLAGFKYGFVLRESHPVNQVATPTKVSTYMASGVIPIMTNAVSDYNDKLRAVGPLVFCESTQPDSIVQEIMCLEHRQLHPETVLNNYRAAFESYFEHGAYIDGLSAFLERTGLSFC